MTEILPVLDMQELQKKANEFAMKGAIKSIEEYYSGYNSPFRKAVDERLQETTIGSGLQLPDIIAVLNDSLSKEIDMIANTAIAQTLVPMVKRFLVREDGQMLFSKFLKELIELTDSKDMDDISITVEKHASYDWLNIEVSAGDKRYDLTLHEDWDSRKEEDPKKKKYHFLSLPYSTNSRNNIDISFEGVTMKIPFSQNVLQDRVVSFIARLIISKTELTLDCTDFDEDMFPERCHCD